MEQAHSTGPITFHRKQECHLLSRYKLEQEKQSRRDIAAERSCHHISSRPAFGDMPSVIVREADSRRSPTLLFLLFKFVPGRSQAC